MLAASTSSTFHLLSLTQLVSRPPNSDDPPARPKPQENVLQTPRSRKNHQLTKAKTAATPISYPVVKMRTMLVVHVQSLHNHMLHDVWLVYPFSSVHLSCPSSGGERSPRTAAAAACRSAPGGSGVVGAPNGTVWIERSNAWIERCGFNRWPAIQSSDVASDVV